jgi:hypothetical protein
MLQFKIFLSVSKYFKQWSYDKNEGFKERGGTTEIKE